MALPSSSSKPAERIAFLDGLCCLAILAVLAFHYFSRYAPPNQLRSLYLYGVDWGRFPPFFYGRYGVQLFFIISGFVIAMTPSHCRDIGEFAARATPGWRWRLSC
jgi:peptidoglycan/LPS O-acetylase OafA/YrhL